MPNPWDSDPIVAPAPGFTGVIPGVPKPEKPQAKTVSGGYLVDPNSGSAAPIAGMPRPHVLSSAEAKASNLDPAISWQVDANGDYKKLGDAPSGATDDEKTQAAMASTRNLLQSIEKARGLVSNWSTGLGGAVGKLYPGSDQAKQLDSIVHQELRGNIFQNWVAQLKATSDTGTSGIGRIMQSEIPLVTGALGALDPVGMGRDQTLNSFDQIENRVLRSAALLNKENPDDPKVLQKYREQFIPHGAGAAPPAAGGPGGGTGGGGDGPPGSSQLSPEQQGAEKAFRATNPTPEQYAAYLTGVLGKQVTVDSAKARLDAAAKGAGYNPGVEDLTEQQKVKDRIAGEDKLGLNESPAETLVKQGATLNLSDEASGIGEAAANVLTSPFTGKFDPVGSYQLGRDVERQRIADAQDKLGYGGTAIEIVGGLASASPTNALAAIPSLRGLIAPGAKAGAAGGALAGFGAGQGLAQSAAGLGVGAAGGAAVGALAPYAAGKLAARGLPKGMAPDVAEAAQAEGVDLIRPMVDPKSRAKFGALESDPTAQPIVRAGAQKVRDQIEGRVADLGQGGTTLEPGAAGEKLQLSGNRYIQRSRGIKDRLYKAAESAGGDTRFVPKAAIDQADQEIAALKANPTTNAGEINFLQGIRDDLAAPGGKTVTEIRNIREGLRGAIGNSNLTMSGAEARANSILGAASNDIAQNVPAAGRLYKRADAFYRERQTVVDDIKRAILGNKSDPLDPQKAFANIKTLSSPGGNLRRLSAVTSYLEPAERQDVAATVASTMGRTAQDGDFSASRFISQTDKMSPAALRTIFGPDGAKSISNLRTLSQALKDAGGDINYSRSTTVANRLSPLKAAARGVVMSLMGMGGFEAGGVQGALTGAAVATGAMGARAGVKVLSARAMVNPRVSQWLAQAATVSTPSQAQQAVKGLTLVISREPALAHELTPIRDFLDQRVGELLAAKPTGPDQQDNQQR